ncbi:saxitoxin and tetrodotoxin-binding protein 2 [Hoplias malabaricus]|uniref:saxitoxin and tetrodotoxin-binding protein 2 n=1 Tax=Hoplias malabaricus TaxID=27720 RepID=UPI003461F79D
MAILISSTLCYLSLLTLSLASDPNCEDLLKPLVLEDDYSSINGKWIFTEGIATHPLFTNILKTVNSSWIEFGPSSFTDTLTLSQGNMLNGKCEFVTVNATVKNSNVLVSEKGVSSLGTFLPSCPDCLTMNFTSQMKNETLNSIYLFMRKHRTSESDMDLYWKQAECLGFKKEPQYSYDGVTEFCDKDKHSSPEQQTKPEPKKEE